MKGIFAVAAVAGLAMAKPDLQTPASRDAEARNYIGRTVTVEDEVAEVSHESESGFTYLNFGAAFPNQVLRAVIPGDVEALLEPSVLTSPWVRVQQASHA